MTYDEIMALSGRELDAAVAEHVYRREVQWLTISGLRFPRFRTGDGWQVVAEFSCDSAMALSVMAWVISRGAGTRRTFYSVFWLQAGLAAWRTVVETHPMLVEARTQASLQWTEDALTTLILEDKLPEAICRAAVYVATRPQWMESNDSSQCVSEDEADVAEECDA